MNSEQADFPRTRHPGDVESTRSNVEVELRELLKWVYEQSRVALFERTHRTACRAALTALSNINHKLGQFRH